MENVKDQLRQRIDEVGQRVVRAAKLSGRDGSDVRILPVTKSLPASTLRALWELGWHTMGENRVQEIRVKEEQLAELKINWALIGHLQTNKAKLAASLVHEVQSIDSLRVAQALSRSLQRTIPVMVQVNTSREPQKSGFAPEAVAKNISEIAELPNLEVNGLMTIAAKGPVAARQCFRDLRELRDEVATENLPLPELSMGMSNDFEIAIEEGATCVRLGQILFGERNPN